MIFNKDNFKQEVEDNAGLVLVDFFAPWCGPCQMMAPIIDEIINEYKDKKVKIGKLNIDENQEIASKYNVMSIPTFLVFKNGKVAVKKAGYCDKEELIRLIDKSE
ncbi:MAG: Thioredoxin [Parcubacteria group bacterium GW2011_GWC2_42_12]|uniref:Thioredoxin n=2 Tax=Candidatus Falkowiibacteriota TaxID=1752728 RepID=A0A1F5S6R5_9BACT|nr:MAG: Thioredoxin [Candidatus Falkowbacteria bacterium GW2011_GWA2_41_14]KKS34823.1 MAG: Thioredoxin [Parcubacteria group bacterium GW2011_GWC2_42_12]OGF22367.1 MAG: thioredoxin [Candidatus Falkowbacteria bacterium RIFCSPHIGHO2_02_FULL_42_9]